MPDFDKFTQGLRALWDSRILTNNGPLLRQFEKVLAEYLGVPYVCVMANGTLPLLIALKALNVTDGEVITTPYSFVATSGVLKWAGLRPVYADVDACGLISPAEVEKKVGPATRAILAVHVYGNPCDDKALRRIAGAHSLPLIYDGAHAFAVREAGVPIIGYGDLTTLSFHATKVFNTIEGGAVVCHDIEMKRRLDRMRNFGITSEITIDGIGINAKMDEMRALFGLLNLEKVDGAIARRRSIYTMYKDGLRAIAGVRLQKIAEEVDYNYSHFPIFVAGEGRRNALYQALSSERIYARRYFYPLITDYAEYAPQEGQFPMAERLSREVLCLPLSPYMEQGDVERVLSILRETLA